MAQSLPSDAVIVKSIKLSKLDGSKPPIDISPQIVEFSIYEDITFPVVRGDFTFSDGIDLIANFPISGHEKIEIEFHNPGYTDISCKYTLQVNRVGDVVTNSQGKIKSYVVETVSQEFITNANQYISEKHKGSVNDIISTICKKHTKTKKTLLLNNDPTKGAQDVLVSRMRPFQAIDFYRKRAVSAKYNSSSYVFFENKRGFNFCTIEYLLDNQKNNINDKIFFYDTINNIDLKFMNSRNILNLKQTSLVDNTTKMTSGSLNMNVKKFDLLTGKVSTTKYVNSEQQHKIKFSSKSAKPIDPLSFEKAYGNTAAVSLLVPFSSESPENFIDVSLGPKHSFISKMEQNVFNAVVYGDVALTAGDVITIKVPSAAGFTKTQPLNKYLEGNYLISKLRHRVVKLSPMEKSYTIAMELIKGSYEDVI
jgi:hypothetical protein